MKLLKLDAEKEKDGVIVEAFMENSEFRQLEGCLDNLISFPADFNRK